MRRERAETKTEAEEGEGREGGHTRSKNSFSFHPPPHPFALTFSSQTLGIARRGPAPATPPASTREREDISASARLDTRGGTATSGEGPAAQTGNGAALLESVLPLKEAPARVTLLPQYQTFVRPRLSAHRKPLWLRLCYLEARKKKKTLSKYRSKGYNNLMRLSTYQ